MYTNVGYIPICNLNAHNFCNIVHICLIVLQNWEVISLQLYVQSIIQGNFWFSSLKEKRETILTPENYIW